MRIGIFSDSINLPPKEGINVHTYNVARALARQSDTEVLLVVCDRGWLDLAALNDQPFSTLVLPPADFYNNRQITEIINTYSLDILQTYMVYFAALVLGAASYDTKKPMVVEFHDLEKAIAPVYRLTEDEAEFHDTLQQRAGQLASLVRVMSAYDYDIVSHAWPEFRNNSIWMPVGIQDPNISTKSSAKKERHLLFIGNTSYPPNANAAAFITQVLAPQLPEIGISLVGRGTERFSGDNVTPYGMQEDISGLLQTHAIGLAPIFEGSGMKIKLLDYLSAGMPVLTTPLGARGYPESTAIIVEENVTKWPGILNDTLHNPHDLRERSHAARKLFLDHFDLNCTITKLTETYRQLQYRPICAPSSLPKVPVNQHDIYWLREVRETPRAPIGRSMFFTGHPQC